MLMCDINKQIFLFVSAEQQRLNLGGDGNLKVSSIISAGEEMITTKLASYKLSSWL